MKIVKFGAAASAKTDERELELLNAFAKTQLKVDEVYIFSVLLCDNEVDRDLERFPVETLKERRGVAKRKPGRKDIQSGACDRSRTA